MDLLSEISMEQASVVYEWQLCGAERFIKHVADSSDLNDNYTILWVNCLSEEQQEFELVKYITAVKTVHEMSLCS